MPIEAASTLPFPIQSITSPFWPNRATFLLKLLLPRHIFIVSVGLYMPSFATSVLPSCCLHLSYNFPVDTFTYYTTYIVLLHSTHALAQCLHRAIISVLENCTDKGKNKLAMQGE